jgi:hypothetical protein
MTFPDPDLPPKPIPGQMDVYEVLDDVKKNGLKPYKAEIDKVIDRLAVQTETPRHLLRDVDGSGPHDRPMNAAEVVAARLKGKRDD